MDIEKLIEQLKYYGTTYAIGDNLGKEINGSDELMLNAATAISTLQAENEKLRGKLEYEQEHANAYYEECGQWEAENEKLRADAVRLNDLLASYQNVLVPELRAEMEQVKAERDAAVSDIENALAYGLKDCELCVNAQCCVRGGTKPCLPKWRGPKKED